MSEHNFQHSWSVRKPSSESHAWSYKKACDACLREVEKRHGVDWKVTDVTFKDDDRETDTDCTWDNKCTWRCTHTVTAKYVVVRRPGFDALVTQKRLTDSLTINYDMINTDYGLSG